MTKISPIRIAWVMPITCIYWQVILQEFVKLFPETKTFTSRWLQDSAVLNNTLNIETVGQLKVWQFKTQYTNYGSKFAFMSPAIISRVIKYKPQIIFADTFCLWTLLVLLTKPIGKWKVILAYEGSSPGVDYRNSFLRLLVRRYMAKMSDASITNSNAGKTYLVEVLGINKTKVLVHPYFVPDTKLFQTSNKIKTVKSKSVGLSNRLNPVFLFIGRLIPRKGIQSLLTACATIEQEGYCNYSLMIIGRGEQQQELIDFCQKHDLKERVKWIGQVDYQEIYQYLNRADILILPSIEDTWGMVLLEAILAGKAIFCSKGAGASEIVAKAGNGAVFEPGDTDKLAQLMKNAIDDPDSIAIMSQKSQDIACQYTPTVAAKFLAEAVSFTGVKVSN